MAHLIAFNKPMNVLSQFTDGEGRATLSDYIQIPGVYAAGRLDYDSEGLLLLTDTGALQHQIAPPRSGMTKTYWVQVEGKITDAALEQLRMGVLLKDGPTTMAEAEHLEPPAVWERNPPVRFRANIPTSWLALTISEGRNRQVRRMTAAVGFPTLRLIRVRIGPWHIEHLQPGDYREMQINLPAKPARRPRKRT